MNFKNYFSIAFVVLYRYGKCVQFKVLIVSVFFLFYLQVKNSATQIRMSLDCYFIVFFHSMTGSMPH